MGIQRVFQGLVIFCFLFLVAQSGHAQTHLQGVTEVHYTMNYPDHIQVQTVQATPMVSTEAFLKVNKDWHLVKVTGNKLFVEKEVENENPLTPILSILRVKGSEPLTIERTGLFPLNQINLFLQFENDPYKA